MPFVNALTRNDTRNRQSEIKDSVYRYSSGKNAKTFTEEIVCAYI